MASISKEEYLKRYLSGSDVDKTGKKKRKKKPVESFGKSNVRIVDDDVGFDRIDRTEASQEADRYDLEEVDEELGENAPIVVGRVVQQRNVNYEGDDKWKTIVIDDEADDRSRNSDSDQSPIRSRTRHDSDESPPRRERHDSDMSPPRRRRHDSDDQSPPRRRPRDSDSDQSPPRRSKNDSDQSPPRKRGQGSPSDQSPPRRKSRGMSIPVIKKEKPDVKVKQEQDGKGRSRYTLGGATAGLQSAQAMKHEARKLKQKEDNAFSQMDDSVLGRGAQTIQRDKQGKKRDMLAEAEMEREKLVKEAAKKAKYKQWGKGLKQAEFQESALSDVIHETAKPLARYKDDEDLDAMLKAKDRDGDPMLQFMRKKAAKQKKVRGDPEKPRYRGPEGPANRFNIHPGYRWDGVDRSNGFEKKLFSKRIEASTDKDLAYKWSSFDL